MLKKEEDTTDRGCYYEQFYANKLFQKLVFPEKKKYFSKLIHKESKIFKSHKWYWGYGTSIKKWSAYTKISFKGIKDTNIKRKTISFRNTIEKTSFMTARREKPKTKSTHKTKTTGKLSFSHVSEPRRQPTVWRSTNLTSNPVIAKESKNISENEVMVSSCYGFLIFTSSAK